MICPKCGNKMARTEKSPTVFIPEKVPDTLDSLQVSKMWVCDSSQSEYSYYLFEDRNSFKACGLGSWEITADLPILKSITGCSNISGNSFNELIPIVKA